MRIIQFVCLVAYGNFVTISALQLIITINDCRVPLLVDPAIVIK